MLFIYECQRESFTWWAFELVPILELMDVTFLPNIASASVPFNLCLTASNTLRFFLEAFSHISWCRPKRSLTKWRPQILQFIVPAGGVWDVFLSDVVTGTVDFRVRYAGIACFLWRDNSFAVIVLVDRVLVETTTSGTEFVTTAGLTPLFSRDK